MECFGPDGLLSVRIRLAISIDPASWTSTLHSTVLRGRAGHAVLLGLRRSGLTKPSHLILLMIYTCFYWCFSKMILKYIQYSVHLKPGVFLFHLYSIAFRPVCSLCKDVLGTFTTLRSLPVDILRGHLDIACLAVNAASVHH